MSTSMARIGPGCDDPPPGLGARRPSTPRAARVAIVISMCGRLGSRSPAWRRSRPRSNRGAESSRPDTNWLDADASISSSPPSTRPVPCTVNGRAPRRSSSRSTPSACSPSIDAAHRPAAGALVAVEGRRSERERRDRREEAHDRAGEAAVDRGRAEQLVGGDDAQVVAEPAGARHPLEPRAERAQPLDHELAVARPERGAQRRRAVGEGGEHELAVRERLRAGKRHDGFERAVATGARHPSSGSVCLASPYGSNSGAEYLDICIGYQQ